MSVEALQKAAEENTQTISDAGESFSNSLMGKTFKPLIQALIRYIKITNKRLNTLEGKRNG
ncbi:hypothetical protein [Photobacterium profundum]|uniref:hypothetical protein n=1 Tax=Photobacterium profundum TaxID=74109 RepID=UPI003D0B881D